MDKKTTNIRVAQNCSKFDPGMNMFKSAQEVGEPTCDNCKHFKNNRCTKDVYDSILTNLQ